MVLPFLAPLLAGLGAAAPAAATGLGAAGTALGTAAGMGAAGAAALPAATAAAAPTLASMGTAAATPGMMAAAAPGALEAGIATGINAASNPMAALGAPGALAGNPAALTGVEPGLWAAGNGFTPSAAGMAGVTPPGAGAQAGLGPALGANGPVMSGGAGMMGSEGGGMLGGLGKFMTPENMMMMGMMAPMMGGGGGSSEEEDEDNKDFKPTKPWDMPDYPNPPPSPTSSGGFYGKGKTYAAGGGVDQEGGGTDKFAPNTPGQMDWQLKATNRLIMPEQAPSDRRGGQVPGERRPNPIEALRSGLGAMMGRPFAEGGAVGGEEQIVAATVAAIKGENPNPQPAMAAFLQAFGPDALEKLIMQVKQDGQGGGEVEGPGDGTSDSVPAQIDGQQPAALSTGEFVVPADVVSGLGNGDTDAGIGALEQMMSRVRQTRTGTPEQAPDVDPGAMLPA